jgi:hypothetical protein
VTAFPKEPGNPAAEHRLAELEERVRRLEETVASLAVPEAADTPARASRQALPEEPPESAATAAEEGSSIANLVFNVLAQAGWSVLTLAGAFLIRALTDRGTVASTPGVALGLAYALGIIVLADRAAARGNRLTAAFLGSTGIFIADAIVAETTTRLGFFPVSGGLVVLAVVTALGLVAGRRHDLPALAWTATLAACATAILLSVAASAEAPAGLLLLVLSIATFWLDAGGWGWRLLAWPATLCADVLSAWATSGALSGAAAASGREHAAVLALFLALGLPLLWVGIVHLRTLLHRPEIGILAVVQTVLALAVGLGGAFRLTAAGGAGIRTLAAIVLFCGVGAYLFAFSHEKGERLRPSRLYWAWLALALLLAGSANLLQEPVPALVWSGLAVVAAAISRRVDPGILEPQSAVLAAAAAAGSGLLTRALVIFTARAQAVSPPQPAGVAALAALAFVAVLLLTRPPAAGRAPAFFAALLAAIGLGAVVVLALRGPATAILTSPLAPVRTVVISAAAYALAWAARATGRRELRALAYLALVLGGLKILIEDVPGGAPAGLFVGFIFYGAALLLVPRLLRAFPTSRGTAPTEA